MLKLDFFIIGLWIFLSGLSVTGCVSKEVAEPMEPATSELGTVKSGQRATFVVLPGERTYVVLKPPLLSGYFVADVRLYENGADIGPLLVEDARRTGEQSFTMVSESLPLTELGGPRPRLSWWGTIWRGNDRQWLTSARKEVRVVVIHRVSASPSGPPVQSCAVLMFGNEHELYTITRGTDGSYVIDLVQVSVGLRSRDKADAVMEGTCIEPERDAPARLRPFERAGKVSRGSRGSKIVWSKIATIAEF